MRRVSGLILMLLTAAPAAADVKLHELFTDHGVLQAGRPIQVWGWSNPGEEVSVELHRGKNTVTAPKATADQAGRWSATLPQQPVTGADEEACSLVVKGKNTITLKNILIGEVWICSGQSNMQWRVVESADPQATISKAKDSRLRLYTVPRTASLKPLEHVAPPPGEKAQTTKWYECSPETVPDFSAVAYHFGAHLRSKRNVPVGLIHTSWGGTPAQAWTSKEALDAEPSLMHYHKGLAQALASYDPMKAEKQYQAALEKWKEAAAKAKAEGKKPGAAPRKQAPPAASSSSPSNLYNAMIAPLLQYAIRGAIWYQGESNAGAAYEYRTLFATMIKDWRARWNQGDFPFLFVQLAPYQQPVAAPGESNWAELREAQLLTMKNVPNTGMAVITDVGEANIHPQKKQPVGERLAIAARALAYGEKIEYSGPIYESKKVEGSKVVLTFKHADGLEAKGGELTGFTICGADKKFVNAKAEITGPNTVAVWCDAVSTPTEVRYGWAIFPVVNLWNKAGLPASPFRTDEFPGVTWPKKK